MSTRSIYTNVAVRRDSTGALISIRPAEFLAPIDPDNPDASDADVLVRTTRRVVRGTCGSDRPRVDVIRTLANGTWAHVRIRSVAELDVLAVITALRDEHGVMAQPDHVYFFSARAAGAQFSPNTFTPNTFTPNTFTPNTFTPNTFTPNTFTPNTFTPNTFTPNTFTSALLAGAGQCCDRCEEPDSIELDVPQLAARPVPAPLRRGAAMVNDNGQPQHVQVHIIDIASPGLANRANFTGEYAREQTDPDRPDEAAVDQNKDRFADPAVAHGDFIASIVRLEGGIDPVLWQAADALGEISDGDLVAALEAVSAKAAKCPELPKVLNLSLAGYHTGVDPDEILLRKTIIDMLRDDWVIVAAAGNNADCRPAMPAAIDGVISVGAIGPCGPAWFSNHGWWVDASAPGVNIVAEWPTLSHGRAKTGRAARGSDLAKYGGLKVGNGQDPDRLEDIRPLRLRDFDTGWAFWSGTSFAAPFVVARIARKIHDLIARHQALTGSLPNDGVRSRLVEDAIHHSLYRDDIVQVPGYGRIVT